MEIWMLFMPWKPESCSCHGLKVFFSMVVWTLMLHVLSRDIMLVPKTYIYILPFLCVVVVTVSQSCVSRIVPYLGLLLMGSCMLTPQRPYLVYTNIDMWTITLIRTTVKYSYRCDRYNTSKWVSLKCRGCLRWFNRTAFGTLRDILAFVV